MRVLVTARHVAATKAIQDYARDKAGRLEHLFEGLRLVGVTLDVGRKGHAGQTAEFLAHITGGGLCVARAKGKLLYEAIDEAEAKLQGQLRRRKARLRRRRPDA